MHMNREVLRRSDKDYCIGCEGMHTEYAGVVYKATPIKSLARLGAMLGRKSKLSRCIKPTIYERYIRMVMTYASPVFAHAAPKALYRLQRCAVASAKCLIDELSPSRQMRCLDPAPVPILPLSPFPPTVFSLPPSVVLTDVTCARVVRSITLH
ncbi:hypothetical protein EVAR_57397_1 [Eumeta japonica]|uniref:RNA-directed DNA polymerase from mobile element jockey n=1 Tax=Eumeta variegata TaxID=151549 RepID=A0A4C1YFC0_EUMVA|nr:hypothetical protein EVAR_57397_1 [Eumeta japonica]